MRHLTICSIILIAAMVAFTPKYNTIGILMLLAITAILVAEGD